MDFESLMILFALNFIRVLREGNNVVVIEFVGLLLHLSSIKAPGCR
jgi:hypothetical protein